MILSGSTIRSEGILHPFSERTKYRGMTYGLGPAGYDVRVEFDGEGAITFVDLFPGDFMLCSTIEYFKMPDDIMGIVHDKSTWARYGIAVQNTVIEPGWHGHLTLEITNHSKKTVTLKFGDPIAQIVFHRIEGLIEKSYEGKYHHQARGPVKAILEDK